METAGRSCVGGEPLSELGGVLDWSSLGSIIARFTPGDSVESPSMNAYWG
jgi:hypothetical protein